MFLTNLILICLDMFCVSHHTYKLLLKEFFGLTSGKKLLDDYVGPTQYFIILLVFTLL